MFSWTTCDGSYVDFTDAECRKEFSFKFSVCDDASLIETKTLPDLSSISTTVTGFPVQGTLNTDYFTCKMAWDFMNGGVPYPLPNFSTGGAGFIA